MSLQSLSEVNLIRYQLSYDLLDKEVVVANILCQIVVLIVQYFGFRITEVNNSTVS